ncbi:MAG: restriction endonuclease [Planctomycetes bacterium]|nr:restriction endonuclease [Planctomycetota bacterium]
MPTFDKETKQLVNAARKLGGKGIPIYLEDEELMRLCAVVATDLGKADLIKVVAAPDELSRGYYGTALDWFTKPVPAATKFVELFLNLRAQIEDFATYFKCLCELHKRRRKYERILEVQAIPKMETIVPRCLLEYGLRPNETLASWLVWRKWLYDIDNRSAQETGYLFEPILTAALGGTSYSHKKSPIKRASDATKGRQVDCVEEKTAYEFKMRVTIAASGQGRFKEELDFAKDCESSGYTPVLLVLDPTPSVRLDDLSAEYRQYGGTAHIGLDAWKHIEEKAGAVMGRFVEKVLV